MSLKKLGMALLAVVVLGAIAANSAFAANEYSETGGQWYVSGSKLSGEKALTTTAVGTQKLATTVAGSPLDLTATGVNCLSCVIKNSTTTTATADGTLEFTGVSVSEPAGCTVAGGTVTTKALTAVVGMNTAGSSATLKFTPQSGTTFATVELGGTECAIAGTYKVTGIAYAKATLATGEFAVNQEITLSQAIQESAGEATSLKFGANAAFLTGAVKGSLAGSPEWGAKKE
jgi:hypothetical protein